MAVSTVPAVKAALKTLLAGATEPSTEVWRNRPNEEHMFAENVYIGDVRNRDEWRTIGEHAPQRTEEKYTIAVDVEVWRDGTDTEACELRMWQIVAQLETALETDKTIKALPGVQWSRFAAANQTAQGKPGGWLCCAGLQVEVTARI